MVCDENSVPNRMAGASSWDPMAMLMEVKRENCEILDQKVATKVALELEESERLEAEQLKIALMLQSEEDDAAIKAALQEEEDLRLAQEAQVLSFFDKAPYRCTHSMKKSSTTVAHS
jgi:hypothetical protein